MESNNVRQTLEDFVRQEFLLDRPDLILTDEYPLIQEGVIDSLGIFVMQRFIDDTFGVKISPDDVVLDHFENINAMVELVEQKRV